MANVEPMPNEPHSQDVTSHVRDYERFIRMFKWLAIVSVIIGLLVLVILK